MAFNFGTSQPVTSSTPLFGASSTTAGSAPLFGSSTTTAPTAVPAAPTTSTTSNAAPLFGSTPAKTPSTGGLFGSATATTNSVQLPQGSGLFGSTTAPAPSLSLGGTTAPVTTPAAPVGLGGSSGGTTSLNIGGTTTTLGATTAEKENIREGEAPAPIMELLKTVQNKIKDNKEKIDEFQKSSSEGVKMIKYRLKEVDHMIADGNSAVAARDASTAALAAKVTKDSRLGKEAQAIQESLARTQHTVAQQHAMQHIIELLKEYDAQVIYYQEVVEQMTIKIKDILQGQGQLTTAELKEYLGRFDVIFSAVANKLFEANSKVEELRSTLNADDQLRVKESRTGQQSWTQFKGPSAFPSQAVLTHIGAMLKPAAATTTTTTGTGLFGSAAPAGGSLFGSASTSKPFFGSTTSTTGGSLFPSLTSTSTAQPTASLFPSLSTSTSTAKPATSFGSTLSTNTTGLLFSSKK